MGVLESFTRLDSLGVLIRLTPDLVRSLFIVTISGGTVQLFHGSVCITVLESWFRYV